MTWGFWMKPDSSIASYSRLFSSSDSSNKNEFAFAPYTQDNVWNLIFDDGEIYRQVFSSEPEKGAWNYIMISISNERVVFYVNGEKVSSSCEAGSAATLKSRLDSLPSLINHALGMTTSTWSDNDCAIELDDVAVYRKALTSEEAASIARSYGFEPAEPQGEAEAQEGIYQDGTQLTELTNVSCTSPDGKLKVRIWTDPHQSYYYSVSKEGKTIIECSKLGLTLENIDLSTDLTLDEATIQKSSGKETYDLIQGSTNHVDKSYQELSFTLSKSYSTMTVIFHIFDDGIGFRYEADKDTRTKSDTSIITSESSEFTLPDRGTIWTIAPSVTYESYEYTKRDMADQYNTAASYSTPLLASLGEDSGNCYVLLSEANVYNKEEPFCASYFKTEKGKKSFQMRFGRSLVQETDETKDKKTYSPTYQDITAVHMSDVFQTPWRAAVISDNLEELVNSSLITDLNPAASGDFSWVKPGASVWSWWSTSYDAIEYSTMLDYIDFAAECGFQYCLVDYGWELWDNYQEKLASLTKYAAGKNVDLLLWYGVNKFDAKHIFDLDSEKEIEEAFAWCEEIGIKGVKVDYINSDSQFAMNVMYLLADLAAQHHLVLNYHGCTNPNGENRTYPNILSSEAVAGMENYKWSSGASVSTLLTLPYTRNVIGSMEFTPTAYRVKSSPATAGLMLAMSVVYESAVQTYAQSAYVYPGYAGLSLLAGIPTSWDESRLISGAPGESIVRARRSGEDWYVGAMTLAASDLSIPLDFLDKGKTYYAHIYQDNETGSNIEASVEQVTSDTVLPISLLANGGCAIRITDSPSLCSTIYDDYTYYEAEDSSAAEIKSPASVAAGAYSSGLSNVGNIGKGGELTFTNVSAKADGEYQLKIYYISGAKRNLTVQVNDNDPITLTDLMGNSNDWDAVACVTTNVTLQAGQNQIRLYNDSNNAPNIDRIAVQKMDLSAAKVTLDTTEYTYSGKECRPNVSVVCNGIPLEAQKDYVVSYKNNIEAGTAEVLVRGIGEYGGIISSTFTIKAAPKQDDPQPVNPSKKQASALKVKKSTYQKAYGDKAFSLNVTKSAGDGKLTFTSSNTKIAKVSAKGTVTIVGTGICTIQAAVTETEHYQGTKQQITIKVSPKKGVLSSVKSKKKKNLLVKWKKDGMVTGYELSYSTNAKFKKDVKTIKIKKAKTVSTTLKKLKKGKKYYIRLRGYKTVTWSKKSITLTGAWSKSKKSSL